MNIAPAPALLPADFYVYLHRKATTGEVFYVGKGEGRRAWSKQRSQYWHRTANKHGCTIEIIQDGLQEWFAHELEQNLIALHGRKDTGHGPLVNLTDGGEGATGWTPSIETVLKISQSNKGRKLTGEQRLALSLRQVGIKRGRYSPEHRAAISRAKTGSRATQKARLAISFAQRGKLKPVECMEEGIVFFTSRDAAAWLQCNGHQKAARSSINRSAKRLIKAYGYTWRYP
jgi:hypothetical protein